MIRYIYIILILMNLILADDVVDNKIYYFPSGASLVSFNTLPDDATINNIFSPIEDKIIAIITSGEISYNGSDANANNSWVGNLTELNNIQIVKNLLDDGSQLKELSINSFNEVDGDGLKRILSEVEIA